MEHSLCYVARPPRLCAGAGWVSTEARCGSVAPVSLVAIRCLPTIRSLPPVPPSPAIRHWELTTGNVTVRRVVLLTGGQEAPRTQGGTKRRGDLTAHRQAFCAEARLLSTEPLPQPPLHGVHLLTQRKPWPWPMPCFWRILWYRITASCGFSPSRTVRSLLPFPITTMTSGFVSELRIDRNSLALSPVSTRHSIIAWSRQPKKVFRSGIFSKARTSSSDRARTLRCGTLGTGMR